MRLLILGGGVFLGAALLDSALRRGHTVTVFNRGRSRTAWPAGVEVLLGDRSDDLPALAGEAPRRWDAVIDTCGYVPQEVKLSAAALEGCKRYLFVSSVSAYAGFVHGPVLETDPLASADGVAHDDRNPEHYGAQKAACEAELTARLGELALIVRPGLIVGPGDPTGRFSYWPWRMLAGGDVLVPGIDSQAPLQFIDVRDLAQWMLHLLELQASGVFNATGPAGPGCTWGSLMQTCVDAAALRNASAAHLVRVAEDFLVEHALQAWNELPLWVPSSDAEMAGFMRVSLQRAQAHGLRTRPLHDTVAAVLNEGLPPPHDKRRLGKLSRQRENDLIALWKARRASTDP
jgi:2'-hydroxyisoflavone reductase